MERLTHKDSQGYYIEDISVPYDEKRRGPVVDRLGAYEDTFLTAEEVEQLKKIAEIFNCRIGDTKHLMALYIKLKDWAQAERDGRLVVLPSPPMMVIPLCNAIYNERVAEAKYLLEVMQKEAVIFNTLNKRAADRIAELARLEMEEG